MPTSKSPGPEAEWNALVAAAFHLDERLDQLPRGKKRHQAVRQAVQSVLESFPPSLDPVDRFQAYAVRRLLLAIVKGFEEARK